MKRQTNTQKTDYVFIDDNIYKSGESFRVRLTVDGIKYSQNFPSKRSAVIFRNKVKRGLLQ